MFLYHLSLFVAKIILFILHGNPEVYGIENLPKDRNVILASTHRSNWDPFIIGNVIKPRLLSFMAKESLFELPLFGLMMRESGMIPVNREKPGRQSIKSAIEVLNEGQKDFAIFPTGTRHSTELKGGTAFIQRMSKKDIILRKKAKIYFGEPIKFDDSINYNKEKLAEVDQAIADAFADLDNRLNPEFKYDPAIHGKNK